jgi:hypothetical protein
MQSLYGATKAQHYHQEKDVFSRTRDFTFFKRGGRKSLNIVGFLMSLMLPWVIFCTVFALMSFGLRYERPAFAYTLVILVFLVGVTSPILFFVNGLKKKFDQSAAYQPTWYFFLACTCFLAFAAAVVAGQWNYKDFMQPNYSLNHLAHYKDVDTNAGFGQQYMDAGYISFTNTTALYLQHSMGFKNHDIFCVAPIVTKDTISKGKAVKDLESLDFWAVGKNCCSGIQADFHCKGFADPKAHGAMRLIGALEEDRAFFRLAVQQAEATYKLTATHPLFFEWVHDPVEAVWFYAQSGYSNYLCGIATYFVVQIFLTLVAMLAFSKMVHN